MRACLLIRHDPAYRHEAFAAGLRAAGYQVTESQEPRPGNLLVIWNRYGRYDQLARRYEDAGGTVLVAENGYLGRDWRSGHWYALAKNFHNGAGDWKVGGPERWDSWGVEPQPWRDGREIVVLATRHIGPAGVAEPHGWSTAIAEQLRKQTHRPVRIRRHPGERPATPLEQDLADAWAVVTWGSGAALKALMMGVPVFYGFPQWIGASAGKRIEEGIAERAMPDRLPMFRRLAWAMWSTDEISTGEPFRCLLR
jgi:hypothetical protein